MDSRTILESWKTMSEFQVLNGRMKAQTTGRNNEAYGYILEKTEQASKTADIVMNCFNAYTAQTVLKNNPELTNMVNKMLEGSGMTVEDLMGFDISSE